MLSSDGTINYRVLKDWAWKKAWERAKRELMIPYEVELSYWVEDS